jgi:protein-S-isoprenylcysteine O-methyltransferase Ste14
MKLISKFALLILILAILYLLISGKLLSWSPFVIAGQLLAVALAVWTRRSFQGKQFSINAEPIEGEGSLLATGPYQVIRHPMYASALLLLWSSILGHISIINVIIGLVVTGVMAVRIVTEEQFLNARFPSYAEYSLKTKRVIPYVI